MLMTDIPRENLSRWALGADDVDLVAALVTIRRSNGGEGVRVSPTDPSVTIGICAHGDPPMATGGIRSRRE